MTTYENDSRGERAGATPRQREEFGGINWGAAFFGWLVAVGIGALLTAFLTAAGTAIAISDLNKSDADTVGIVGAALVLLVALIAYFAGGYVAGRMSRFDGARQGGGVWVWSIVIAIVLAVLGAIAGSEYNLFGSLDLPRIPIDEGDLTTGGVILLIAVLLGTLLAAIAGGKAGERYHRRVDAAGYDDRRANRAPVRDRRDVTDTDEEPGTTRRTRPVSS